MSASVILDTEIIARICIRDYCIMLYRIAGGTGAPNDVRTFVVNIILLQAA